MEYAARWYVYRVDVDGRLGYIGKGSGHRFLSSARRLNGIAGIIQWFHNEAAAFRREIQLIAKFKPPLNKSSGGEGGSVNPEVAAERQLRALCRNAYKKGRRNRRLA